MSFYVKGGNIILDKLKVRSTTVRQVSLADDITGVSKLNDLITWCDNLMSEGKNVNESKSRLISKDPVL